MLKSVSRLLNLENFETATFKSAQEFIESGNVHAKGCLVLDLSMPNMNGMDLYHLLVNQKSSLPVIFLTGHGSIATGIQAMKLGATDFLTKPVQKNELISAIRSAFEKSRVVHETDQKWREFSQRVQSLTPREHEVLSYLVQGKLNKQIAAALGTVEQTIKVHRSRVMIKMKVNSIAELVNKYALFVASQRPD